MKIRLVGAELFVRTDRYINGRTDRQTDMTKLIVVFRSFANAPKNCYEILPMAALNWELLKLTYSRLVHRWWNPKVHVTAFGSSSYWHHCTLTYVHCSLSRLLSVFLTTTPLRAMCSTLSNPWFNIPMMDSTDGEAPHFTSFFNLIDVCFFGPDIHPSSFFFHPFIFSLCFALAVGSWFAHPYKTECKIEIFCFRLYDFVSDRNGKTKYYELKGGKRTFSSVIKII